MGRTWCSGHRRPPPAHRRRQHRGAAGRCRAARAGACGSPRSTPRAARPAPEACVRINIVRGRLGPRESRRIAPHGATALICTLMIIHTRAASRTKHGGAAANPTTPPVGRLPCKPHSALCPGGSVGGAVCAQDKALYVPWGGSCCVARTQRRAALLCVGGGPSVRARAPPARHAGPGAGMIMINASRFVQSRLAVAPGLPTLAVGRRWGAARWAPICRCAFHSLLGARRFHRRYHKFSR
jgi:hypothetical protein